MHGSPSRPLKKRPTGEGTRACHRTRQHNAHELRWSVGRRPRARLQQTAQGHKRPTERGLVTAAIRETPEETLSTEARLQSPYRPAAPTGHSTPHAREHAHTYQSDHEGSAHATRESCGGAHGGARRRRKATREGSLCPDPSVLGPGGGGEGLCPVVPPRCWPGPS